MADKRKPPVPPVKFFDWEFLESLAILEARCEFVAERMLIKGGANPYEITSTDIASMHKRINRRLQKRFGVSYVQYVEQKREGWRVKLRSLQRANAVAGNVTMQIWLGKQELGQTDKNDFKNTNTSESKLVVEFTNEAVEESEI
jgi:hypothetical protein